MKKLLLFLIFITFTVNIYSQQASHYRRAAEQGDAWAQYNLAACYFHGQGVNQDYTQAVYWYGKAAEQGNDMAQFALGESYANGQGVKQDDMQAVFWYRKAAEQGNGKAQMFLGFCYFRGQGVPQDYTQTISWFHKAAEQGNSEAQLGLVECYSNDIVVSKDSDAALYWLERASQNEDGTLDEEQITNIKRGIETLNAYIQLRKNVPHIFSDDIIETIELLGLKINVNLNDNPPQIEGQYYVSPLISGTWTRYGLGNESGTDNFNGDVILLTFSEQHNTDRSIMMDYAIYNGGMYINRVKTSAFITGENNKFSVFAETIITRGAYLIKELEIHSGEITANGIKDYQVAVIVFEGDSNSIEKKYAILRRDDDGFSERINFDANSNIKITDLQLLSLNVNGELYQNQKGSFTATLKNNGKWTYNSRLWFFIEKPNISPSQSIGGDVYFIAAGETKTINITGNINLIPDTYNCNMLYDANNNPSNIVTYQFHNVLGIQTTVKEVSNGASANDNIRKTYTTSDFVKTGNAVLQNFNGKNYIGDINSENGILLILNSNSYATVRLSILYRSDTCGGKLIVNGVTQNMDFPSTNWAWGVKTVSGIQLIQGTNTIEFRGGYHTEYAPAIAEITIY